MEASPAMPATCSGVSPNSFRSFTLCPSAMSAFILSLSPSLVANISGVFQRDSSRYSSRFAACFALWLSTYGCVDPSKSFS
eukprot:10816-Pelagococcus_subviridis.AAC.7